MPQYPLSAMTARNPAGSQSQLSVDNDDALRAFTGGALSALNVIAVGVIKAGAGRVGRVIIIAPGSTSGAFTLNDSATTGGAAAANVIWSLPYNNATNVAGASFEIDFPFTNGLVVSAVPGGGSPILAISYS